MPEPKPKVKIVRTSTVPLSMKMFCKDLLCEIKNQYDILAVSSAGAELDDVAAAGIPTQAIEMRREISPVADLRSLIHLIRLCRRERPQIIHSITPKAGLLTMIAARVTGVPIRIHSFTGLLFPTATGLKKQILKLTDRITCACATHILPEGEGVKQDLISARITKRPLTVLGHGNVRGIDLEHFQRSPQVMAEARSIRDMYGIGDGDMVYVFVGRIVNDKGISELAEAFARLVKERPNTHLILVGEEEPTGDTLKAATKALLESTPHIHRASGWIDDVRPYYAAADALVFPSYREGFPNVVIEAGAMGLPSIVTDINGSREIIIPGTNGDIIPARDSEQLYGRMLAYTDDRAYTKRMAARSRELIASRYEASYVRGCLKAYYRQLLDRAES